MQRKKWQKHSTPITKRMKLVLVQTRGQFEKAVSSLLDAKTIAVDTETDGYYVHQGNRLCGISMFAQFNTEALGTIDMAWYFPFRHQAGLTLLDHSENLPIEWLQELRPILEKEDIHFLLHNAKFDRNMLKAEGFQVTNNFSDTLTMAAMVDETAAHKLEKLVDKTFGWSTQALQKTIKELATKLGGYHKIPPKTMEPYACQDVKSTFYLYEHLNKEIYKQELDHLLDDERDFTDLLMDMEWRGIRVNVNMAKEASDEAKAVMRELENRIGFDPMKNNLVAVKLFHELGFMPKAITKNVSPEFPKGIPQLNKETLESYDHPVVKDIIAYRKLVKANSTWFEGFLEKADAQDRIHPVYNWRDDEKGNQKESYATKTTRLSTSNPNCQQFPRDPSAKVRQLIIPTDGYRLYSFDYSNIEFRLGAIYAEDEGFLRVFREDGDAHQLTADELGFTRFQGKTFNFSIIYLGGIPTIVKQLSISEDEARDVLDTWHGKHPGYRRVAGEAYKTANRRGYVRYWNGRRRHFPPGSDCGKAWNSLIQGGAAEIVKRTMLLFFRDKQKIPDDYYHLLAQIHDALVFELKEEIALELAEEVKDVMEWPGGADGPFDIPFPVEYKEGF